MSRMHLLSGLLFVLISAAAVRADPTWSYNWLTDTSVLDTQTGGLTLATTPAGVLTGSASMKVANISLFSSQAAGSPESLATAQYLFTLDLQDELSQLSGTLSFTGSLSGTFSTSAVNLTNTFLDGVKTLDLGNYRYSVSLSEFNAPGPAGSGIQGSIRAMVEVSERTSSPPVSQVPEPSSLFLAGLGMPALALAWKRIRRRRIA